MKLQMQKDKDIHFWKGGHLQALAIYSASSYEKHEVLLGILGTRSCLASNLDINKPRFAPEPSHLIESLLETRRNVEI